MSIKEISVPSSSYLYYLDHATQKLKVISATGDVGDELVENGDFSDGLNGWTASSADLSLSEGRLTVSNLTSAYGGVNNLTAVFKKPLLYNIKGFERSAGHAVRIPNTASFFLVGTDGDINQVFTTTNEDIPIGIRSSNAIDIEFSFTSMSVKEVLPTSTTYNLTDSHQLVFNCTKPLTANEVAQVEAQPNLIYDIWFNAPNTLVDGFAKADMVNFFDPNGDNKYIQDLSVDLGSELALNNTFDTDTDWSLDDGVTISDGYCNFVNAGSLKQASQNAVETYKPYNLYLFTMVIEDFVEGNIRFRYPHMSEFFNSNGTHTFVANADSEITALRIQTGEAINNFKVASVSVKKLTGYTEILGTYTPANRLQNQLKGANALLTRNDASGRTLSTMPAGEVAVDDSGKNVATGWNIGGDTYTITQIVSGELQDFGGNDLVNGDFSDGANDWTLNGNWSITDKLIADISDSAINAASREYSYKADTDYLLTFDVLSMSAGSIIFRISNNIPLSDSITTAGTYSFIFRLDSASVFLNIYNYSSDANIDNISIKELTTKTQRQEYRRFVKDSVNGNSYYIDDVLQVTPPPEPTGELKASRIPAIGHSDTVDSHHGEPMVYSRAITEAEGKVVFEDFLINGGYVIYEGDGVTPMRDEFGNMMFSYEN